MKNYILLLIISIFFHIASCSSPKAELYPGERDNLPDVSGYIDQAFDEIVDQKLPEDFHADSNDGQLPINYLGDKKYSISSKLFYKKDGINMIKKCYAEFELIDLNNLNNINSYKLLNFKFEDTEQ